jgi:hypothetical protein
MVRSRPFKNLGCHHLPQLNFFNRVDHLRSVELCASALRVACELLSSGSVSSCVIGREGMGPVSGTFVAKLWAGGEQQPLLAEMRSRCSFLPLQYFSNLSLSLFSHFAQCLQIFYRQTMQAAGLATRECRNVFCMSRVQRGK